jgi:hypothetical protein
MGGANAWRPQILGTDWMREIEKRLLHEERRPQIRNAADLLGPGIAPYSVLIQDWEQAETFFNGFFHSEPGALNSPDGTRYWMGVSQSGSDLYGIQRVSEYRGYPTDMIWPRYTYLRKFSPNVAGDGSRVYSSWRIEDLTQPGMICEIAAGSVMPNGYLPCDGDIWSATDYPDLYAVLETRFNQAGDPAGSFRTPTISGKIIKA